ncbi:hypothetical protein OG203_41730 [Nocardia sp. NBC_01499]|uniref:hypothetical protein n=1 Tax=Nocardia sp. NBC_01499 TaxID=2903597 RepID=UPI003867A1BD
MTPASLARVVPRQLRTFAAAVTIAPFIVAALHAAPAVGHGYLSPPASHHPHCAQGVRPCGPINEPQSVEGPKSGTGGIKGVSKKKLAHVAA